MREIKFKLWHKKKKKMLRPTGLGTIYEKLCEQFGVFGWDDIIILQYTGLKDVNGKEIYEGDIVVEKSYPMYDNGKCNYRCVVVWYDSEACFGLEMHVVSNRVRGCAVPDSLTEYTQLEVVGTIHSNPELTGETK